MKEGCLAYNTTVHSSTGQTLFFATFGREAIVPIHWVYPIPRPNAEKDVSAWTETIQERFQTAYAGMREKQQQMVRRNAQYYKPILNQFNIGQWVWIFDPRIIPGSCDKLRSYWAEARVTPSPGSDHPGWYSDAAAVESATQTAGSSNHTTDTVNQLYIKHPGGFSHPGVREYSEP